MQYKKQFGVIRATTIDRISRPFLSFLEIESSGGIVLLICTITALVLANSTFSEAYITFWNTPFIVLFGDFRLDLSLQHWVNDGLMTIFFFVIGLEIKRELINGELRFLKAAALPVIAAIGGMVIPATVYALILQGKPGSQGWAIPMATDIAFVVGFLALLGKRVPHGLKIFLLSLAIVDDIGAIIVIAVFYSATISFKALSLGLAGFGVILALNRLGVRRVPVYLFVGILIWFAFYFSGIHPTIAGVILGLLTPASPWIGDTALMNFFSFWRTKSETFGAKKTGHINGLIFIAKETLSPLERLETAFHPWVAFFIIPIFALANAAIPLAFDTFGSRISIGVAAGLFFGKVAGIVLFSFLAIKLLGLHMPTGSNWPAIIGCGFLAGIGFTMSFFIAGLALNGIMLIEGKSGTLLGSAISAFVGFSILFCALPKKSSD